MKKEELVIKNTLQMTKETDEHLSQWSQLKIQVLS